MTVHTDREAELLAAQAWRTETPGHEGWSRTTRPDDANKLYVISADCHAVEPRDWMSGYIDEETRAEILARRTRRDEEMDRERADGMREPKGAPVAEVSGEGNKTSTRDVKIDSMNFRPCCTCGHR